MRIDAYNLQTASAETSKVTKTSTDATHTEKKVPLTAKTSEDKTTLTTGSDKVQTLTNAALATASTRAARVETLKQAVSSGQYQLDSSKTAKALTSADA